MMVIVHVENPEMRRSSTHSESTFGFSPMSHESFVSVENLVLSMASPAAQQLKLSQWNVSQIYSSMENFMFLPPARPMTSSQPNLLDKTFVSDDSSSSSRHTNTFYDNFAFERTDSDRSQNSNLQRHYSSNNLVDAENYLQNMTMRPTCRKPSIASVCSTQSGTSCVSGRSGRSAVSHIGGCSSYSTATAYSARSGVSAATAHTDSGYCVKLARKPKTVDHGDMDRSASFPQRVKKYREPPPEYKNPPPYGSIHRTASVQTLKSLQSESDNTPLGHVSRSYVGQRRTHSMYSPLWEHSSSKMCQITNIFLVSSYPGVRGKTDCGSWQQDVSALFSVRMVIVEVFLHRLCPFTSQGAPCPLKKKIYW
jgi:hypothetical protein